MKNLDLRISVKEARVKAEVRTRSAIELIEQALEGRKSNFAIAGRSGSGRLQKYEDEAANDKNTVQAALDSVPADESVFEGKTVEALEDYLSQFTTVLTVVAEITEKYSRWQQHDEAGANAYDKLRAD